MGNFSFPCRKLFPVPMWSMQPADGLQGFWPHRLCSVAAVVGAHCQLALPRVSLSSRTAETLLRSFQNEVLCNFREENFQNCDIFFSESTSPPVPLPSPPPPPKVIFFRICSKAQAAPTNPFILIYLEDCEEWAGEPVISKVFV